MEYNEKRDVKFESGEIFEDRSDHCLYAKLTYGYEAKDGYHKVIFPKVALKLLANRIPGIARNCSGTYILSTCDNEYPLFLDEIPELELAGRYSFVDKLVTPRPTRRMTIEEIEEELGYSVEIVSNEAKEKTNEKR